jgi:hypothetical protein
MPDKFGIEIEFVGDRERVASALTAAGIPNNHGSYSQYNDEYWTVKTDGSVYNGGEIASPPIEFDSARRAEVSKVVEVMRNAGCVTSEQAGIHVHVNATDLTEKHVAAVAQGTVQYEDFLYRLASSGWPHMRENAEQYAHPISRTNKALLVASEFSDIQCLSDRYNLVNFGNFLARSDTKKTLEFRLFNTSMNKERVQAFIAASVGFVRAAHKGRLGHKKLDKYASYPLGGMVEGFRTERATFASVMRILNTEVLSEADRLAIKHFWRGARPQPCFGTQYRLPGWYGPDAIRGGGDADPFDVAAMETMLDDHNIADSGDYDEEDGDFYCNSGGHYVNSDYVDCCWGCDSCSNCGCTCHEMCDFCEDCGSDLSCYVVACGGSCNRCTHCCNCEPDIDE